MTGESRGLPERFHIELEPHRETLVVAPHGEIDIDTIDELRRTLGEVLEAGFARIVLDLRQLCFIDAAGLRAILDAEAASRSGGIEFALIQGPRAVQHLFELTTTDATLPFIEPTAIDR